MSRVDPRWAAWQPFIETSAQIQTRLDEDLRRQHGLTLADYQVLLLLSHAPQQRLRMSEIADAMLGSPDYPDRHEAHAEKVNGSWGEVSAKYPGELERDLDEHLGALPGGRVGWRFLHTGAKPDQPLVGGTFGQCLCVPASDPTVGRDPQRDAAMPGSARAVSRGG